MTGSIPMVPPGVATRTVLAFLAFWFRARRVAAATVSRSTMLSICSCLPMVFMDVPLLDGFVVVIAGGLCSHPGERNPFDSPKMNSKYQTNGALLVGPVVPQAGVVTGERLGVLPENRELFIALSQEYRLRSHEDGWFVDGRGHRSQIWEF